MKFLEMIIYRTILRTHIYIEETGRDNSFARFPFLRVLTERLNESAGSVREEDSIQAFRYHTLLMRLEKDAVLNTAFDLVLSAMHVPEFAAYLNYYTGNHVTMQFAFELEGIFYPAFDEVFDKLKRIQKVCRVEWEKNPLSFANLSGDSELIAYLTGADQPQYFESGAQYFSLQTQLHEMYVWKEKVAEGADCLQKNKIWQIWGRGGRRFLTKHVAKRLKKNLIFIDPKKIPKKTKKFWENETREFFMRFVRSAFFWNAIVCIYEITPDLLEEWDVTETDFLEEALKCFLELKISLILCTSEEIRFWGSDHVHVFCSKIGEIDCEERESILRGFAELYNLKIDCSHFAIRYPLTASEIAHAIERWCMSQETSEKTEFSRICCELLQKGQDKIYGHVSYPSVGFEDLKLPHDLREVLVQICCSVTNGHKIYEQWNLKRQYPYGRAVTVLLTGPAGTGKTMTAHVLANELDLPLYQVDLSAVMDKYIGETEKHLEQIFSFAQKTNALLFFDEADSLFGKRGEVTEGKDRYANMEVSYILQRIEQFNGIVVLATNFYGNIDKAFLRRMKYVLKYQIPDVEIRRSIWESCLSKQIPKEELDIDFLTEHFDFTGGMIKNVVLSACVMALYENTALNMGHLLRAVSAEYEKLERSAGDDIWGEYKYLFGV